MKVLFLTPTFPSITKRTGADIATQSFIDALKQNACDITLVGYCRKGEEFLVRDPNFISVGSCYVEMKEAKFYPLLWFAKSILSKISFTATKYYSQKYVETLQSLLKQEKYDFVILDHSYQLGWLEPLIPDTNRLIVIAHNIEHEVYRDRIQDVKNLALKWMYQRETRLVKQSEDRLAERAFEIWALTEYDSNYFTQVAKQGKVRVLELPPSLSTLPNEVFIKNFDIGMIGSWIWGPNGDGLKWFFQNVYPHLPIDVSIQVAGRGAEWLQGKYPNVEYKGFVPDAKEFMVQAKVLAIPATSGGGIQIKTLDSIGLGMSIVATPFALRGIDNPPSTVKIAKHPKEFAEVLESAIRSPSTQSVDEVRHWSASRHKKIITEIADTISRAVLEVENKSMQAIQLAVLLTCHNRREKTLESIDSLYKQSYPPGTTLAIYLVDDGSTDGTAEKIKALYPDVTVLQGDGSLFWNGGMHLAFAEAIKSDYDFYLWLNDDTVLYESAISLLLSTLHQADSQNHCPVIILGATQDPETKASTYGGLVQRNWWHPLKFDLIQPKVDIQVCDTLHGNCVLIPRKVVQIVGNLDPAFKHNLGDYDYGLRARKQGCEIWMVPGYIGTCSPNPHYKRIQELGKSFTQQWQKVSHPNPKGLAFKDVTLHSLEEWKVFSQRHGGFFWRIYWLFPYRRVLWSSFRAAFSKAKQIS